MAAESGEEKRGIRSGLRSLLVFLLILAAISALLHLEKSRRVKDISRGKEKFAVLVRSRPVEETKAKRIRFYETRLYLGYPVAVSYATADLLRRIDGIVPPLRLRGAQVDPGLHDMGFELTVEVPGPGPGEVRRRLAVFLECLRNVPNVTLADLSEPGPIVWGGGERVFSIHGRAELQL